MTIPHEIVDGVKVYLKGDRLAEWQDREAAYAAQAPQRLMGEILEVAQAQLNAFANTRGYDGILSACTYATSSVPKFAAEGQYCVELRDQTWATLYAMLADIEAGARPLPASFEEIAHELPITNAEWPN